MKNLFNKKYNNKIMDEEENFYDEQPAADSQKIELVVEIDATNLKKDIFFLGHKEQSGFLYNELNNLNTEMFINYHKCEFTPVLSFSQPGKYTITYQFSEFLESLNSMFYSCEDISEVHFINVKTDKVTDMSNMFCECKNLLVVDLGDINTENVKDMSGMFHDCVNLVNLDISAFNTKNVTDMKCMFYNCYKLQEINLKNFVVEQVNDMFGMFMGCKSVKNLDLSSFCFDNVFNMVMIFSECNNLESVKIQQSDYWKISNEINKKKIVVVS